MGLPETERHSPDQKEDYPITYLDTEGYNTLIQNNPAIQILSEDVTSVTFGENASLFKPSLFHPVHVVRVQTADGIKTLLRDGHHRTGTFNKHRDVIERKHPHFRFAVQDLTDLWLDAPEIASLNPSEEKPSALTMEQYLRIVIEATHGHKDIAPRRMAAHLITGWESMVGTELAERFSGIAALTLLEDPAIRSRSDKFPTQQQIDEGISGQQFFEGSTLNERRSIRETILKFGNIIRETGIGREALGQAAFELIGEQSETIGGPDKVIKQLFGLFYNPHIRRKLETEYGPGEALTHGTAQLGEELLTAYSGLKRFTKPKQITNERGHLHKALMHVEFNLSETRAVITANIPSQEYSKSEVVCQKRLITKEYLPPERTEEDLEPLERDLIDRFASGTGRKLRIETAVQQVKLLVKASAEVDEFMKYLDELPTPIPADDRKEVLKDIFELRRRLREAGEIGMRKHFADKLSQAIEETKEGLASGTITIDKPPAPTKIKQTRQERPVEDVFLSNATRVASSVEGIVYQAQHHPERVSPEVIEQLRRIKEAAERIVFPNNE